MSNLPESSVWTEGIYQLTEQTPVLGKEENVPGDGPANLQAKQLADRTVWLRDKCLDIEDEVEGIQTGETPYSSIADAQSAIVSGAIPEGVKFSVRSSESEVWVAEYYNNNGIVTPSLDDEGNHKKFPSKESLDNIFKIISYDTTQYLKIFRDEDGGICFLIDQYGEVFSVRVSPKSLQETLRDIADTVNRDSSANLHDFPDINQQRIAFLDDTGDLYIPGLGRFSVQHKIRALDALVGKDRNKNLSRQYDNDGQVVTFQDEDGKLYLPGLGAKSVQERFQDITAHYARDRAPYIKKLTDAESNILSFTDEDGKLYLPGLGAKSVQERFQQLSEMYNRQYKSKAIFDAWDDFQIDWNGNNSVAYQLQAAIDKVSALPYGGSIFFSRPGFYLLHKYITARNNVTLRGVPGVVFMPMLQNSAFYYRYSAAYLENFNLIDIEIDGTLQHGTGYDVGAKGTYLQYFRNVLMLRCNVHDTGATGIGNDYPDRSFILDCVTDNCGRMAPDGVGGASGIGIGLGALPDEPLVIANAICRGSKNYGMFFEQQRLSGPGQPYISRQITVANAICTGNGYGFGDCGAGSIVVVNGQFNDNLKTGVNIDAGTLANNGIAPRPGKNGSMINCHLERNGVTGLHYDSTKIQADGGYSFSDLHINDNGQDGILLEAGSNTLADVRFDDMDIKDNGRYPVNVASGTFTDLDFTNLRMLRNGGDTAFKLDGNITQGTIHDCKLRSQNGAAAITGAGAISHFDIAENQYTDTNSNPINLTGILTDVTYGRNPGIQE